MKKILSIFIAAMTLLFAIPGTASATSEDECSIWLCLPGGFPSGCGAAHSAMMSRIKDDKDPLPDFDSCAENPPVGSGSHMTYEMGVAAYVPTHQECTQWGSQWNGGHQEQVCVKTKTIAARYVEGMSCQISCSNNNGTCSNYGPPESNNPPYCTASFRYVKVFVEGGQVGTTYYW